MSKTSSLAKKNLEFSATNRTKTYKLIVLKALQSQCSSSRRRKSTRLTGIRSIIRDKFPELSSTEVIQAQDNISEWFAHHKNSPEFDYYRSHLPFIFLEEKVENKKCDEVEEKKDVVKISDNEVATVQEYATVQRVTMIETPSGYKIHL